MLEIDHAKIIFGRVFKNLFKTFFYMYKTNEEKWKRKLFLFLQKSLIPTQFLQNLTKLNCIMLKRRKKKNSYYI